MARSTSNVPHQGLSAPEDLWAKEIREYLLGRLSTQARTETLAYPQRSELTHAPVRRWWTFEGKRYESLGGPLAENWDRAITNAQLLEQTYNPRLRLENRPEGVVDWARTLARGPLSLNSSFVVRSSGIGLSEEEREALQGWAAWISREWYEYTRRLRTPEHLEWRGFHINTDEAPSLSRLRRWAHIARRSRWPLLRDVVAESFRPILEPSELDRIPLPAETAKLFELLCLVRIARVLAPLPRELRWLDYHMTDNVLDLEGMRCFYQESLPRDDVLATPDYKGSLAAAVGAFAVRIPHYIDIAFDFDVTRASFDGIIVEAKSGSQQYGDTVSQLRVYRAVRARRPQSRFLVWGIVERPDGPDATDELVRDVLDATPFSDDVWLFSSADAIPNVLRSVFGGSRISGERAG